MLPITPARLRAVGFLLLEVAGIGVLIAQRMLRDPELRAALARLVSKARLL